MNKNLLTQEEAIKLARYFAYAYRNIYPYLPQTEEEIEKFEPHEWIIDALIEASRDEY